MYQLGRPQLLIFVGINGYRDALRTSTSISVHINGTTFYIFITLFCGWCIKCPVCQCSSGKNCYEYGVTDKRDWRWKCICSLEVSWKSFWRSKDSLKDFLRNLQRILLKRPSESFKDPFFIEKRLKLIFFFPIGDFRNLI